MGASLGSLLVSLGLDAAEFTRGLTAAEYQAQQFRDRATKHINDVGVAMNFVKGAVTGLAGAFSVSVFAGLFTDAIKESAALKDLAEQTGVSVESLSGLQEVARVGGHDFTSMTGIIGKLNKSLAELYNPASKASEAFKQIGLSQKDLAGLDAGQALQKIAQALGKFSDEGPGKAAFAMATMGKSAAEALPFIKDLAEAGDLSATTTEAQAEQAKELEKDLKQLSRTKQDLVRTISFALVPALDDLLKLFLSNRTQVSGFRDTVNGLAADGSLQRWFQDLALFVATTSDEFNSLIGIVERFRKLGTAAAEEARGLAKVAAATSLTELGGSPDDAAALAAEGWAQATAAHDKYQKDVEDGQKKQTNYEKLLETFRKRAAEGNKPPADKGPKLNFQGGRETLGAADDPTKKLLEGQLKALDAYIQSEKDLLSTRAEFLQTYFQQGDLSIAQYYTAKQTAQDDDLEHTRAAYAEEVRLLQARNALPTSSKGRGGITEVERQENLNKIGEIQKKLDAATTEASKEYYRDQLRRNQADQQYKDQLGEINAQVLELAGNSAAAAKIRFDASNRVFRKQLAASGDTDTAAAVDALGRQKELQAGLNDEQKKFSLITERAAIAQERINLAQSTGAISEIAALQKTSELARSQIAGLSAIADAYERIAKQSQDPADLIKAEQLRLAIEKLGAQTDLVADKFNKIFGDSFASAFDDVISGTKSVKDAFKDMEKSIVQSINKIASQQIADSLFGKNGTAAGLGKTISEWLSGGFKAAGSSGSSGGWLASLFGGGTAKTGSSGAGFGMNDRGTGTADDSGGGFLSSLFGGGKSLGSTTADTALTTLGATAGTTNIAFVTLTTAAETAAAALLSVGSSSGASGVGSLFGTGSSTGGAGDGFGAYGGADFGGFFAAGGRPPRGKVSIVGERGPELFVPNAAGTIIPNDKLGGKVININQTVNVMPGANRASADQAAAASARSAQEALRKYG